MTAKVKERLTEIIHHEVELYNQYLSGDVYGFVIEKNGEQIESCWGGYGEDSPIEEAQSIIDHIVKNRIKKHCQQVKNWIKNKVPINYRVEFCL